MHASRRVLRTLLRMRIGMVPRVPQATMRQGNAPDGGRVSGAAEIGFAARDGATRLAHLFQHDPLRVLFPAPEPGDAALAVLVTTSGGLVAGDRIVLSVCAEPGSIAHVTASAAEKIYRSTGATTEISQISFGRGATPGSNTCRPRRSSSTAPGFAAIPSS